MTAAKAGPLAGLSVVELGDGFAAPYVAKLLGDYGADVIKIEPPEGDSARRRGPFPAGRQDPEASGLFAFLNTNKFGVVLDLDQAAGQTDLDRLLVGADIFVTNLPAARLAACGLAPQALRARHPRLVITLVSPFGATGPWAGRRGSELVSYAMGGLAYSTPGVPDAAADLEREPPLHPACFAAETISGVAAAVATMSAILGRERTGTGCAIDCSQQAAVAAMQQRDITAFAYRGETYNRLLNPSTTGRMPNFYLPCRDGHVVIAAPLDIHWARLVEGMGHPDWASTPQFATTAARTENWRALLGLLGAWAAPLDGDDICRMGSAAQLPIFRFHSLHETLASDHLAARASLVDVVIGGVAAQMPGPPVAMRATPWALHRPAPRHGEHTETHLRGRTP